MNSKKTQGEVEAEIGSEMSKFYTEMFGRGPKSIKVDMIALAAVVLAKNSLSVSEKHMLQPIGVFNNGHQIFKSMRTSIIEISRMKLIEIIEMATGVSVSSLHHDMSTVTGEEAFIFSLLGTPEYRKNLQRNGRSAIDRA
jgi:uncharacterized protein YbcI